MNPLAIFTGPMGMVYKWIAIGLMLAAFGGWSYMKGVSRESDRRDANELKQQKIEREAHARAVAFGSEQVKKARAAQAVADDYQQRWKEALNAARRNKTPLAVADCPAADSKPGSGLTGPAPGPLRLRLTWEFVGLLDSAYTDSAGQSLYGDTARAEKAAAGPGSASPYTLDDLADLHGINAPRWDACRRQLRALVETIDGLERQWDERHAK